MMLAHEAAIIEQVREQYFKITPSSRGCYRDYSQHLLKESRLAGGEEYRPLILGGIKELGCSPPDTLCPGQVPAVA